MTTPRRLVALTPDKRQWSRSPLPGQVVLVTTVDGDGDVDVAPKSWVSMAAFDPPRLGFGCNIGHRTCQNVIRTAEFVVNVLPAALAPTAWAMLAHHGAERVEQAHLGLLESVAVRPPRIAECSAHLECVHDRTVDLGNGEVFVFGRIVAVSIDERALDDDPTVGYRQLDPCFFLQSGLFAGLGEPTAIPPA